jgi:hypothetical protein
MDTLSNGFAESYYVLRQEYPSTSTSCHSVYTLYTYSADSLSKCIYIHTQVSWLRVKTLDSVMEKNYMCLKAYALNGIEPSLTHIKSYHFVFHTHTHLRYIWSTTLMRTFIYIYIYHRFLLKFFLS